MCACIVVSVSLRGGVSSLWIFFGLLQCDNEEIAVVVSAVVGRGGCCRCCYRLIFLFFPCVWYVGGGHGVGRCCSVPCYVCMFFLFLCTGRCLEVLSFPGETEMALAPALYYMLNGSLCAPDGDVMLCWCLFVSLFP